MKAFSLGRLGQFGRLGGHTQGGGASTPAWVPSGAAFFYDFANSRYWNGAIIDLETATDFTGGPGTNDNAAGVWSSFALNVPRITDEGVLIEVSRQNKCTNFNANPTNLTNISAVGANVVLSIVDDVAALAAAGLANLCTSGKVLKLDNTAGATEQGANFGGQTGNTNAHSFSAWVRSEGGATARILDNVGSGSVSTTSASYVRLERNGYTPGASTRQLGTRVSAGGIAYFILNQLEEGSAVSSPIIIAGAAATRAVDALTLHLPSGTLDLTFTFDNDTTQQVLDQSGDYAVPTNLNRAEVKSVAGFF